MTNSSVSPRDTLQPTETYPSLPSEDRSQRALLASVRPPQWRNPAHEGTYNLVVIGAGPAGLVAARAAAALGAKVALIERNLIGGACLNVGCVPSKAIIRTSRLRGDMQRAEHFGGWEADKAGVVFPSVMERMRRIRARIGRADSAQRLSEEGIDVYFGQAQFVGRRVIAVDGRRLYFRKALIATGTRPMAPEIPGLAEAGYLTNENVFDLTERPRRLLVVGGGPLGCELAQAFCRLGSPRVHCAGRAHVSSQGGARCGPDSLRFARA